MYCLTLYKFTRYINGTTGLFHIIMFCFNRISCLPLRRRHYFFTNQWEALWAGRHVQPRLDLQAAAGCTCNTLGIQKTSTDQITLACIDKHL